MHVAEPNDANAGGKDALQRGGGGERGLLTAMIVVIISLSEFPVLVPLLVLLHVVFLSLLLSLFRCLLS